MPGKKEVELECKESRRLAELLKSTFNEPRILEILECHQLLCSSDSTGVTSVYCLKRDVSGLIELVLRRSAVSGLRAPEHAGILLGTSVKGEIRLSLHLAYILATRASRGLFRPQQGVIAVNRHGERAFTFSKPVGISDYRVLGVSPTNTYLVLSEQGDPLGWGTLDPHKRLVPLIDSGWFLRAGW